MNHEKRQLVKILEEICKENHCDFVSFSDDWILQIKTDGKPDCLVIGYKFPNNNAAASKLCDDKSALSSILESKKIPCVPHIYFEGPKSSMVGDEGIYGKLFDMFDRYGSLVCKTNSGSGGNSVFLCKTRKQLESATFDILRSSRGMAVSPKIDIKNEYRIIVENNRALLVYSKERPHVIGDGKSTIGDLMKTIDKVNKSDEMPNIDYESIPALGEKVTVAWKHNLGQGSLPILIEDENEIYKLSKFALKSAKALGLQFASIDIVIDSNDNYMILEINSGVMMEKFSKLGEDYYKTAKHIYERAIYDFWGLKRSFKKNIYEQISEKIVKGE